MTTLHFRDTKGLLLVDFWAPWCEPCKRLAPILDALAATYPDLRVEKVNVEEHPAVALQHEVRSIPMVYLYKDGTIVDYVAGLKPATEYDKMVAKALGLRP